MSFGASRDSPHGSVKYSGTLGGRLPSIRVISKSITRTKASEVR